jgi:trigger factor
MRRGNLMSIKEIKSGTLYKEYALEIPYEEINKIIDSKINELLPTVSLPGFRKGKAPINIVRKKYENNVLSDSLDKLVQDKMKELLDEKKYKKDGNHFLFEIL